MLSTRRPVLPNRLHMWTPGQKGNVVPGSRQLGAEVAAYAAGADDADVYVG